MYRSILWASLFTLTSFKANAIGGDGLLSCFACCCQNPFDDCLASRPALPNPDWKTCPNKLPWRHKWACAAANIDFPTVDCLVEDIKTCGLLNKDGAPTVFYSFGIYTKEARPNVRDKVHPQGNMFNDGLMSDPTFMKQVLDNEKYGLKFLDRVDDPSSPSNYMNRANIFVARMSEALAKAAKGDVYLVYSEEVGKGGKWEGLGGIYQLPLPDDPNNPDPLAHLPNAWRTYELPTLQQNDEIKAIYGVDKSKGYPLANKEWPGNNLPLLPESNAMQLPLPPKPNSKRARFLAKRDDRCPVPGSQSASQSTSHKASPASTPHTTKPASITAKPTPTQDYLKCNYYGPEPDAQPLPFCSCEGKKLPLMSLSTHAPVEESCSSYTAMPTGSHATNPNPPPPKTTNSDVCEVCSLVAANENACERIPHCTPLKGFATVEHGSSAVNVGTLRGNALYTSVSSALLELCPEATKTEEFTHCETDSVSVGGIEYVEEEERLDDGSFVIQVEASQYNTTQVRDGMIKSVALTAQHSASEGNTYTSEYEDIYGGKRRRSSSSLWFLGAPMNLARRALGLDRRDSIHPTFHDLKLWRAINFAGAHYYSPFINVDNVDKGTDYIDVNFSFEAGGEADLICDFEAALIDALALTDPAFVFEGIELGEAVQFACDSVMNEGEDEGKMMRKRRTRRRVNSREVLGISGGNATIPFHA